MTQNLRNEGWQSRILRPRLPWSAGPIRPADVSDGLVAAMFARENILEDVNYQKVVPNRFIVEVNQGNYLRNYQSIENRIIDQWNKKMMEQLLTANSRQGRKEFHFGGRLQIEIRPVSDLEANQARILSRIQADQGRQSLAGDSTACLEMFSGGQRISLRPGITTIGRRPANDIFLDTPEIQERRLISGQHAYIVSETPQYRLFDGSPDGKPSVNGTFVNYRRIPSSGHFLQDGDLIILASADPNNPRPDAPGVAAFHFRLVCK